MRIVHVVPFYTPVIGGVEEVARKIAEYTASRGYETYVVTYNRFRNGGVGSLPREEIGRHLWVHLTPIWNMGKEGFQRFYEELPGFKPIGFIIKAEEC